MSIRFTGDKTALRRTTSLPSAHNAFTLCGFAKLLTAAPSRQSTIAYTQNASGSSAETALLGGTSGTGLRAGDNYNSTFSPDAASVTAGGAAGANWFFWALVGVGSGAGGLRIYHRPLSSGSLTYQSVANTSNADAFSALQFGDSPFGTTFWLDGLLAHLKIYNRALSDADLLAEAGQGAPVSTTALLSYHAFSNATIGTAVAPDQGTGTFGYSSSAPSTSTDMPVFSPILSGLDTLPTYDAPIWGVVLQQSANIGTPFIYSPTLLSGSGVSFAKQSGPSWASVTPASGVISGVPTGTPGVVVTTTVRASNASGFADLDVLIGVNASVITSITAAPASVSVAALSTVLLTVTGSAGAPVIGASATSLAPSVATVSPTTSASGQLTVTGVAGGSTTIAISYTDPTNGVLTATVAVAVGLATPAAPSGLTATAQSATSVLLGWADNSSTETAFRVERADAASGPWVQIATPAANVVTYTDSLVAAQRTYYYRLLAANVSGASAASGVAAVTTPPSVDAVAPTCALTASLVTITTAGSPVTLSAVTSDNVGVTLVRFYRMGVEFASVPVAPQPNAASTVVQSVVFGSNAENGVWSYTARAFDAAGNSTLSGAVVVTVAIPAPAAVPNAPSALTAIGGLNSVTIAYVVNSTNEDGFYLERKVGGGNFSQVATLAAGVTSYTDTPLLAATAYTYRVRAFGPGGASGYTTEATATTSAAPATSLASVAVAPTVVSDVAGRTATLTYTARDGNGSGRPGVTITPIIGSTAVATVAPPSAITDAQGRAFLTVTFGSVIAQTQLRVAATDGASTLTSDANPAVDVFTLPAFTEALVKELQAEQQDPKYQDEIQPYVFDFSPFLGRGEDVSRVQMVESVPVSNAAADPNASAMVFGQARIVGNRVLQYFRDGVPGVSYFLRCRVETTIGRVVVSEIRIRIYRARGARVSSSSPVVD
jgi:hypothetical protein